MPALLQAVADDISVKRHAILRICEPEFHTFTGLYDTTID